MKNKETYVLERWQIADCQILSEKKHWLWWKMYLVAFNHNIRWYDWKVLYTTRFCKRTKAKYVLLSWDK